MSDINKPGRGRCQFISLVRTIVEKYGGHLDIDIEKDTFTVFIPQERKIDCFQELDNAVGPLDQIRESVLPFQ
jgi:hypothetical protein